MKHLKYKIKTGKACVAGEHNFIVSGWNKSQRHDTAHQFTCSHCLTTMYINEYEVVRDEHDCKAKKCYETELAVAAEKAAKVTKA